MVRYLLDTCATVDEAKQALLAAKHYYFFTPCHFVVADGLGGQLRLGALSASQPRGDHRQRRTPGASSAPTICCTGGRMRHSCRSRTARSAPPRSRTTAGARSPQRRPRRESCNATTSARSSSRCGSWRPVEGARTFWHAQYDVDAASMDVSFYLYDRDGVSIYSDPREFRLR